MHPTKEVLCCKFANDSILHWFDGKNVHFPIKIVIVFLTTFPHCAHWWLFLRATQILREINVGKFKLTWISLLYEKSNIFWGVLTIHDFEWISQKVDRRWNILRCLHKKDCCDYLPNGLEYIFALPSTTFIATFCCETLPNTLQLKHCKSFSKITYFCFDFECEYAKVSRAPSKPALPDNKI